MSVFGLLHPGPTGYSFTFGRTGKSMILRAVNDITENDLLALISDGVAEGRSIDYKRELPGNSDGDKKEFLADASSFANTEGGDLVFGMLEPIPTKKIPSDA